MAVQVAIRVAVQVAIRVAVQVANQGGGLEWQWPTCTQRDVRIVLRSVEECGSLRVVHQIRERSFGHVLVEHGAALGRAWRGGRRRGDVLAVADRNKPLCAGSRYVLGYLRHGHACSDFQFTLYSLISPHR